MFVVSSQGQLTYPNPRNACGPVESPPTNTTSFQWFALITDYDDCPGSSVSVCVHVCVCVHVRVRVCV